jgi:transketolase
MPESSEKRINQDVFSAALLECAKTDPDILVVTSDSRGSGKLVAFGEALPRQHVEVGIAEQNLVGVAAGLASVGKKPVVVSPACFLTARSIEQIKNDVCYSDQKVILVGISAGVSYGALGSTHHSTHDYAALRAVHNLAILAPADANETIAGLNAALKHPTPVYMRLGKKALPQVHSGPLTDFDIGRAYEVRQGNEIVLMATGETVWRAVEAARLLAADGISARVLSFPTIRPLDTEIIRMAAVDCGAVLTVEEHSIHGGLGEACAASLLQAGIAPRFNLMGIPDEDTFTGSQEAILEHYGISGYGIYKASLALLRG